MNDNKLCNNNKLFNDINDVQEKAFLFVYETIRLGILESKKKFASDIVLEALEHFLIDRIAELKEGDYEIGISN